MLLLSTKPLKETENIRYRHTRPPTIREIGVLARRPPASISPISAAMPAPMIIPPFMDRGIHSTSLLPRRVTPRTRSEEHTSELQSRPHLVCRLLLEKKKNTY